MDATAIELSNRADARFADKAQLDAFCQEVAENFCPWLADFTRPMNRDRDFAAHLVESTPVLFFRDLVGQGGAMLRPVGKQYFNLRTESEKLNADPVMRRVLDWRSKQMLRMLNDRVTNFSRATRQADDFYFAFGNAVLSVDVGKKLDSLRFQAHHIKDCAWGVNDEGRADRIDRRDELTARQLRQRFGEAVLAPEIKQALETEPDKLFPVLHCVLPCEDYDFAKKSLKRHKGGYASVWVDRQHKRILRETLQPTMRYVIPRWVTMTSSVYALSPATTVALPDARLAQAQAAALLEAMEKSVNPPLIATSDVVRGAPRLEAGGITWLDKTYDERLGEGLRALDLGKSPQFGMEGLLRTERQLSRGLYLDVLRMPDTRHTRSIPEVQFLIDEYVRSVLPLLAPISDEYNGALLHETYDVIEAFGGFADGPEWPQGVAPKGLVFQWDNPLTEMVERQVAQSVGEVAQLAQTVAAVEAAAAQAPGIDHIDTSKMFRSAVMGVGRAEWLYDEKTAAKRAQAGMKARQQQQLLAAAPNIAQVIDSGVSAAQAASEIPGQSEPGLPLLPPPMGEAA